MVNELVDVYSRIKSLEAEISLLKYQIDKMSEVVDKVAQMGQINADILDSVVKSIQDDRR